MYGTFLRIGSCFDLALVDANGETIAPQTIFKGVNKLTVTKPNIAPTDSEGYNASFLMINPEFVRLTCGDSYCRGYGTDNIWWSIKTLIVELNKKAFISYKEKVGDKIAAGAICISTPAQKDYYGHDSAIKVALNTSSTEEADKIARSLDATVGVLALSLDKREAAGEYFKSHTPDSGRYFFREKNRITYAYPTNFWVYSSALAHLIYGAARIGFGMYVNNLKWPKKYNPDVAREIILACDVKAAKEFIENTYEDLSCVKFIANTYNPYYGTANNNFLEKFEFIAEHGPQCLGPSIYDNWRMKRLKRHFVGHLNDLPGWENSFDSIFNKKANGDYGQLWKARKAAKVVKGRIQQPF